MIRLAYVDNPNVPDAITKALKATLDDIANTMNHYAKEDTGALKGSMTTEMESNQRAFVIWDIEYAAYAYYKGRPSRDKNFDAQLRWAEYAKRKHGQEWMEDIRKRAEQLW